MFLSVYDPRTKNSDTFIYFLCITEEAKEKKRLEGVQRWCIAWRLQNSKTCVCVCVYCGGCAIFSFDRRYIYPAPDANALYSYSLYTICIAFYSPKEAWYTILHTSSCTHCHLELLKDSLVINTQTFVRKGNQRTETRDKCVYCIYTSLARSAVCPLPSYTIYVFSFHRRTRCIIIYIYI